MKLAFRAATIKFWAAVICVFLVIPAGAQKPGSENNAGMRSESGLTVVPYRTYAEFALDMLLNQMEGRGLDVAIDPDEYIVGPGDEFGIYFVSSDIYNIVSRVGTGGELFIKSVGAVEISGTTLSEAIQLIKSAVSRIYSGTGFDIQLTDFRFIRVNVLGEVAMPGLYYVPAVWRVSEVIELSGGLTPVAASRRIVLRGDDSELPVDLVRYKTIGDIKVNPFIGSGHTVVVPGRQGPEKRVSVSGLVTRPGIFSVVDGDRLSDFLAYASGPRGNPADMMIQVSSQKGELMAQLDGADAASLNYVPNPGENVTLMWKEGRQAYGNVTIMGEVARPGIYPITSKSYSLQELLDLSGGITLAGCPEMIRIYRWINNPTRPDIFSGSSTDLSLVNSDRGVEKNDDRRQMVSYNPRQPMDRSLLLLADGDSLYVPRITGMVSINGAVASPGLVRFLKGKGVDYYLEQAGGLGYDADRERMVVVNPVTGGGIDADKAGELFDGEMLFVPRKESVTKP
jgi:protein involved in polysaccharide export with SLBB domain